MAREHNVRGMAKACKFDETNVRPDTWNIHDNCKGDCTTRALTYCLGGEMTYDQVEAEQYRLAKVFKTTRNRTGVYDIILSRKGWKWIQLSKPMARGEVAVRLAKKLPTLKAMTLSRRHIAAVEGGRLIDTWDSRGDRVFAVMVPGDSDTINQAIWCLDWDVDDLECKVLPKGVVPKNTSRCLSRRNAWNWVVTP